MNRTLLAVFAVFGLALTGCASKEEKGVKLMEEMANLTESNKENCDKMGEELNKFVDSNKDTIAEIKAMKKGQSEDENEKKKFEEKYGERVKAAGMKMMGGAMKCATNAKVGEAMKKM